MFSLHSNTKITSHINTPPVNNAIAMLKRDMEKRFLPSDSPINYISLTIAKDMDDEAFRIVISRDISIFAKDDLGFVYGLLSISELHLGIRPFWFWLDQKIDKVENILIIEDTYYSPKPRVRFRGWFFNDEVLFMKWNIDREYTWRMAFEALLRCGGNLTIPGTDKLSHRNAKLASSMGLWITHHHAEPLGAEMFVRAYPGIEPDFDEHPELFFQLWQRAVLDQKDYKVIWNLCFRGQGDCPFWATDTTGKYDTPEKQGALITKLIKEQCDIVKKHVKNPIFCTNLYGEIMELYEGGHLDLDPQIIKVRADNGFGKMVTRRRDNHSMRISSMPDKDDKGRQGIYYHVSFYDLQAANHITMLPNSVNFVSKELDQVLANGGDDFWVVNCSNVRPHVYYLDAIRKKWFGQEVSDRNHSVAFTAEYFSPNSNISKCFAEYPNAMLSYGNEDDEHAGEQFYTENIRILAHHLITCRTDQAPELLWLTGDLDFTQQIRYLGNICEEGYRKLVAFEALCKKTSDKLKDSQKLLFDSTLLLNAQIHKNCAEAVISFANAYEEYLAENYKEAFMGMGKCAECFDFANRQMRNSEYGIWKGFYQNDCFTDIKHSAYMARKIMGLLRELGDNVRHDAWYRDATYREEDKNVYLLLVLDNHMTDWELYKAMREAEKK